MTYNHAKYVVGLGAVAAVLATPATAAAPTLTGLQRQITALRAQVVAGQARIVTLEQNQSRLGDITDCNYALQSDNLNSVWHTVVLLAQYNGFPPQPDFPRYDDRGACARLGVTRSR